MNLVFCLLLNIFPFLISRSPRLSRKAAFLSDFLYVQSRFLDDEAGAAGTSLDFRHGAAPLLAVAMK